MSEGVWKEERFKRMKEAKLAREALLNNPKCHGVHIYKGHRHIVLKWMETA